MSAKTYRIYNSAMATTAAPVAQPSGAAIRTMMQLKLATGCAARVTAWGVSGDAAAAATPGKLELIETDVGATGLSTAYAAADLQPFNDPNAPANTAGTGGVPFNLGTSASGFATGAVTEGTTTASRIAGLLQLPPTAAYETVAPLGREFELIPQRFLRVRATFAATVNLLCWVEIETN